MEYRFIRSQRLWAKNKKGIRIVSVVIGIILENWLGMAFKDSNSGESTQIGRCNQPKGPIGGYKGHLNSKIPMTERSLLLQHLMISQLKTVADIIQDIMQKDPSVRKNLITSSRVYYRDSKKRFELCGPLRQVIKTLTTVEYIV